MLGFLFCLYALFLLSSFTLVIAKVATQASSTKNNNQLVNFISGGIAGTISSTITIPLEVIKTQLQSSRIGGSSNAREVFHKIYTTSGVKGFYKGLTPMLVS